MRRVRAGGRGGRLPQGVEVYSFPVDGAATRCASDGDSRLDGLLPFIDPEQRARYFIGDRHTSPERPSNATVKLGIVRPHSGFTPHAHGGEHFVLSLGYASCGLYDSAEDETVQVDLTPGTLIRIPALLPHSFGNRAGTPLLILAANTGYGIDHEDYAITAEVAESRDSPALVKALRALGSLPGPGRTSRRERVAHRLHRLAARLERT